VSADDLWIFGYGSLIARPGFSFVQARQAIARDWARRFWQGSHDHRGEPHAPGRVVTLVRAPGDACRGRAFHVAGRERDAVLRALDHREKNGYERTQLTLELDDGSTTQALTYIAEPRNFAFLGPAPLGVMARHIARSAGPSGSNPDYLFELAAALRDGGIVDPHVERLAAAVRGVLRPDP
jgi:cation transport protein ChaC